MTDTHRRPESFSVRIKRYPTRLLIQQGSKLPRQTTTPIGAVRYGSQGCDYCGKPHDYDGPDDRGWAQCRELASDLHMSYHEKNPIWRAVPPAEKA